MTREHYFKIPAKINNYLKQIEIQDPFLFEFMDQVYMIIKDAKIPVATGQVHGCLLYISEEESILLAAEFLGRCDESYQHQLLKEYKEGKLQFSKTKKSSILGSIVKGNYKIIIRKTNTIIQAQDIVHEMFHCLNLNNYIMNRVFTETVSIVAELMFQDFLREKGYKEYDISLLQQYRGLMYTDNLKYLQVMLPLFLEQKESNKNVMDSYDNLAKKTNLSPREIKTYLTCFWNKTNHNLDTYKYTLGYILAKTFVNSSTTLENLKEINELLHNNDIAKFQEKVIGKHKLEELHKYATEKDFCYHPKQYIKNNLS